MYHYTEADILWVYLFITGWYQNKLVGNTETQYSSIKDIYLSDMSETVTLWHELITTNVPEIINTQQTWHLFTSSAIPSGPDTDWNYWFGTVKKGAKTGKDNGFSVLFDIESFDYGYYDEGSEGLKVFWGVVWKFLLWQSLCFRSPSCIISTCQ